MKGKRLLSLAVCLMMVLSVLQLGSVSVSAEEVPIISDVLASPEPGKDLGVGSKIIVTYTRSGGLTEENDRSLIVFKRGATVLQSSESREYVIKAADVVSPESLGVANTSITVTVTPRISDGAEGFISGSAVNYPLNQTPSVNMPFIKAGNLLPGSTVTAAGFTSDGKDATFENANGWVTSAVNNGYIATNITSLHRIVNGYTFNCYGTIPASAQGKPGTFWAEITLAEAKTIASFAIKPLNFGNIPTNGFKVNIKGYYDGAEVGDLIANNDYISNLTTSILLTCPQSKRVDRILLTLEARSMLTTTKNIGIVSFAAYAPEPPSVSNVAISPEKGKDLRVGNKVVVTYTPNSILTEGGDESIITFREGSATGDILQQSTDKTYTIKQEDVGKVIFAQVLPKSADEAEGAAVDVTVGPNIPLMRAGNLLTSSTVTEVGFSNATGDTSHWSNTDTPGGGNTLWITGTPANPTAYAITLSNLIHGANTNIFVRGHETEKNWGSMTAKITLSEGAKYISSFIATTLPSNAGLEKILSNFKIEGFLNGESVGDLVNVNPEERLINSTLSFTPSLVDEIGVTLTYSTMDGTAARGLFRLDAYGPDFDSSLLNFNVNNEGQAIADLTDILETGNIPVTLTGTIGANIPLAEIKIVLAGYNKNNALETIVIDEDVESNTINGNYFFDCGNIDVTNISKIKLFAWKWDNLSPHMFIGGNAQQ